jgi:MoaA/NifB/PqqE/SkfB family radical SAM enzyme
MLLDAGRCSRLSGYGESLSLSVSLQGPRDLHDRIRGEGSWNMAVKGISLALAAGLNLEVFTSAGRSLLPELPRFAEWLYGEFPGIQFLKLIQLIRVTGDEMDLSEELLAPENFIALVKTAALLNLYGRRVSVLDNPFASAVAARLGMPWIPQALPLHRAGRIVVMADLSITHSHSSRVVLGTYSPGALEKVFRSSAYHDMAGPDTETCPRCRHMDICRAHEMIRPSEWYRDMHPEVPYCKRVMGIISRQPQSL